MKTNYVDKSGKVVAYFIGDVLYRAENTIVGSKDAEGNVISEDGEIEVICFHEGLYKGPNQPPIAWLEVSEFPA